MRALAQGRYTLGRLLGVGGMAEVYEATDTVLGAPRAIKLLRAGDPDWERTRTRLRREAQVMARLNHPHVLKVVDIGLDEGQDYVVMELASAGSLADRLEAGAPLPVNDAVRWTIQVLSALQAAHDAGVVHRDVKPQNVLLDARGNALLADFGIALISDVELRHTRTDAGLGSLVFMAPEQRLDARSVGPAADLYAVGCSLYMLLTDASPMDLFVADDGSARWQLLPASVRPVVRRAVSLRPEDRYPSARAMAEELAALHPEGPALMRAFDALLPAPDAGPRTTTPLAASTLAEDDPSAWAATVPERLDPPPAPPAAPAPPAPWGPRGAVAIAVGTAALVVALSLLLPRDSEPPPPTAPAPAAPAAPAATPPVTAPATPVSAPALAPVVPATPPRAAVARPRSSASPRAPEGGSTSAPEATSADAPGGSWQGTLGGYVFELTLGGDPGALRGTTRTWSRSGKASTTTRVEGRYDPSGRRLTLRDVSDEPLPDACEYQLQLSVDGSRIQGSCLSQGGSRTSPIALRRPP